MQGRTVFFSKNNQSDFRDIKTPKPKSHHAKNSRERDFNERIYF